MFVLIQKYGDEIVGVWVDSGLQGLGFIEVFLVVGYEVGKILLYIGGDFNVMYQLFVQNDVLMVGIDYLLVMGVKGFDVLFDVLVGKGIFWWIEVNQQVVVFEGYEMFFVKVDVFIVDYVLMDKFGFVIMFFGVGVDYDLVMFMVNYLK